ncbi:FkbM family methyltransferase [Halomicroarcula sp. F28]|uniref:FkbM family methyltransferase n=1 Tax=Haloarcula salinisoli TaxID=2487746 RepID=UPI001C7374F7|nr:FkbM family methyltransferase [Halomicroarcula salinisoli]MBX0285483.1 FkbM family methyltransferase [Halomicroarcula salinisoli]
MLGQLVSAIGSTIQGTPLEEPLDRAYYDVWGPRQTEVILGGLTAKFNANSSSEYLSAKDLGGESEVIEAMLENLSEDDVVWDVGSFVGWHAALFGQIAETVAFEADPDTFAKLHQTCTLNPNASITPVCLGLGNPDAPRERVGIVAGEGGEITEQDSNSRATTIANPATLIDSSLTQPSAMKLDVQGLEGPVIAGFGDRLEELDVLFVEFHEGRMVGDWTPDKLHDHITDFGLEELMGLSRREDILKLYVRP